MWLNMLAVKKYFNFSCLYGRWKCYGNFTFQNKVNVFVILETNCKINSLWVTKIPYLYINDVMERYYILKIH